MHLPLGPNVYQTILLPYFINVAQKFLKYTPFILLILSALIWGSCREDFDFDIFNSDLLAVDVNSGEVTKLTEATGPENNPHISPDGDTIAFTGLATSK